MSVWSSVGELSLMTAVPVAAMLVPANSTVWSVNVSRSMFHSVSTPSVAVPPLWFTVTDPLAFVVTT